jgi:hypothetical protein
VRCTTLACGSKLRPRALYSSAQSGAAHVGYVFLPLVTLLIMLIG